MWMGTIHFASTDVPVKLHTAVSQKRVEFHLFHKTDRVRLRQQMICAYEKEPVSAEEQVKGFQLDDRKYVLVDPEELDLSEPQSSRIIEVHEFVKAGEIDPVFLDRTYHLEPDFLPASYFAFASALKEMNVEGICTWVMRKRSHVGAVYSAGSVLRLKVLRYADEIILAHSLGLDTFSPSEKELNIGTELIDRLTVRFEPQKYGNEHVNKLLELIRLKARGGKFAIVKPKRPTTTEPDKLLAALEASLKKAA